MKIDSYKVIDDFLPKAAFEELKRVHLDTHFPWFYIPFVAEEDDNDNFYFIHRFFYDNKIKSDYFKQCCLPLLNGIGYENVKDIIRIKSNLFTKSPTQIEHGVHIDCDVDHITGVFSVNTNNGYTQFDDGTKIESIENRMLLFHGQKPHQSVSQTDTKQRINININYIGQ